VGTTDDRTFFLLWTRVIRLPYLATYEPSNPMCMRRARVLPTQAAFRVPMSFDYSHLFVRWNYVLRVSSRVTT